MFGNYLTESTVLDIFGSKYPTRRSMPCNFLPRIMCVVFCVGDNHVPTITVLFLFIFYPNYNTTIFKVLPV